MSEILIAPQGMSRDAFKALTKGLRPLQETASGLAATFSSVSAQDIKRLNDRGVIVGCLHGGDALEQISQGHPDSIFIRAWLLNQEKIPSFNRLDGKGWGSIPGSRP